MSVESSITIEPGLKIAAQMSPEPDKKDLEFVRQMGVEYVVLWTDGNHANYDYFASRRDLFEKAGHSGGLIMSTHDIDLTMTDEQLDILVEAIKGCVY